MENFSKEEVVKMLDGIGREFYVGLHGIGVIIEKVKKENGLVYVMMKEGIYYKDKDYPKFITCTIDGRRFGTNTNGYWFDDTSNISSKGYYIASEEEVSEHLIKEAKKRGFKVGDYVLDASDGVREKISEMDFEMFNGSRLMVSTSSLSYCFLFDEGKWATIIKTITKEQAEKQLGKVIKN